MAEAPQDSPERSFRQEVEISIDEQIRDLKLLDEEKAKILVKLKGDLLNYMGDHLLDKQITEEELKKVYDNHSMWRESGFSTNENSTERPMSFEDFKALLGYDNFKPLAEGEGRLKGDSNIFDISGKKMIGITFRTDEIKIDGKVMIGGKEYFKVTITHDNNKYNDKRKPDEKVVTGYIPVEDFQKRGEVEYTDIKIDGDDGQWREWAESLKSKSPVIEIRDLATFEEFKDQNPDFVVFLHAPWCGGCNTMEPFVDDFAIRNPGTRIVSLNFDQTREIKEKYFNAINTIPVLAFFNEKGSGKDVNIGIDGLPIDRKTETVNIAGGREWLKKVISG